MKSSIKLLTFLVLVFSGLTPLLDAAWVLETVDATGNVGKYSSMGTDPWGHAHICYFDVTNRTLKYATNKSGSWVTETLDDLLVDFGDCSLAVDSIGGVHISYAYGITGSLKYATNRSGMWVLEDLSSSSSDAGYSNSIAVDQFDHVHIAYMAWSKTAGTYNLIYATNITGSWKHEGVDITQDDAGYDNSIAVDLLGNVHLCYSDYPNKDLIYARRDTAGTWSLEVVEWGGHCPSIEIDSNHYPHIGYAYYSELKHAVKKGVSWTIETVVTTYDVEYPSLDIDSQDKLHISYQDKNHHNLCYATNASGTWTNELVDVKKYTGGHSSLAVDKMDRIHISHYDGADLDLRYATRGDPLPLTCDVTEISESTGGTANFSLNGGAANGGRNYILLGGITGTVPGTPLPGGLVTLPLNMDLFTNIVIGLINTSFSPSPTS